MGIKKNVTTLFGDKKKSVWNSWKTFRQIRYHQKSGINGVFYFYYNSMWKSLLHTTFWGEQFSNFFNGYEINTESYFLWYPYWIIAKFLLLFAFFGNFEAKRARNGKKIIKNIFKRCLRSPLCIYFPGGSIQNRCTLIYSVKCSGTTEFSCHKVWRHM